MFVVDKVNGRILRYSANALPQSIPIPSTYMLDGACGDSSGWINVSASKDKLFFRFTQWADAGRRVDRLAVLSVEGEEQHIIDLEPYYPLHATCLNALVADGLGGIYVILPPVSAVHFDADYRPTFIYLGSDAPFFCDDLVLGWDGNLYTYNHERDAVDNWRKRPPESEEDAVWIPDAMAAARVASPLGTRLLGADTLGRLYVSTFERGHDAKIIRFSAARDQIVVAAIPEGWSLPDSLAPDGSLYGISYDPDDPSVGPEVFKCVFDEDLLPIPFK